MTTFFLHWYNIQPTQAKHDQLIENLPDQRLVKIQDVLENLTCLISKKKKIKSVHWVIPVAVIQRTDGISEKHILFFSNDMM